MSRAAPGQFSFAGGELSPKFRRRRDLARYAIGARELTNLVALPQGPATRRPGTRFVTGTKNNAAAILINFQFSTEQAYIIEAGHGYFRFFMNGGAILSGGSPYEVVSPYTAADLTRLRWTQSADVLFLVHPAHPPRTLSRAGHTSWVLAEWVTRDGPYLDTNVTDTTVTPSATSGTITLSASAGIFAATDVGRPVRLRHTSTWGWCRVTAFTSATQVSASVTDPFGGTGATAIWRLGAWSAAGWPGAVTFHENRLAFAASGTQPGTIWLSCAGDFDNFAPTANTGAVAADNAITATAADDQVNAILWIMSAHDALVVGTSGGPFAMRASDLGEAIAPTNVTVRRVHMAGAAELPAVRVAQSLVYASRTRKKLFQLTYDWTSEGYQAPDLALVADHITRHRIAAMAYQQEPWSLVWATLDTGLLVAATMVPELDVLAWHRHPLGGTDAKAEAMACIPGADRDELWLIVARTVDGGTARHIEILEAPFEPADADDRAGCYFVDAGLSYEGEPASSVAGLDHLEGETVQILADGAPHPDRVVTDGAVELQFAAASIHVGLPAPARMVSLDQEPPTAEGSGAGKPRRADSIAVGVLDSTGGRVGIEGKPAESLPVRRNADALGAVPSLYTGTVVVKPESAWTSALHVVVEQTLPLPLTITELVPRVSTMDAG